LREEREHAPADDAGAEQADADGAAPVGPATIVFLGRSRRGFAHGGGVYRGLGPICGCFGRFDRVPTASMKALFFVLAAACFLASLGGGGFYIVGLGEEVERLQDTEREISSLEAQIKRLGDAPSSFDARARRDQDYAFEDALRKRQQASDRLVQGRRYLAEWRLAFVGAAFGPLLLGGLFLFLGLRARRAAQIQLEALRGSPPAAPGAPSAPWPIPVGVVVVGGVLIGILFATVGDVGAGSPPATTPATSPGEKSVPTTTGPAPSPGPDLAPVVRSSGAASSAPAAAPGGTARPSPPRAPDSPRSPSVPTSKTPGADPFQ
jgi:hypothetical protein